MKRNVMIEIYCGPELCMKCKEKGRLLPVCNIFRSKLEYNGVKLAKRCAECLAAERKANGKNQTSEMQ